MNAPVLTPLPQAPSATRVPRLLLGLDPTGTPVGIEQHLAQWGTLSWRNTRTSLLDDLDASGLVGHGGAWFPVATKWRSVRGGRLRRPVVVANAAEGEPASSKDELLMTCVPHLVLDGASAAGVALDAGRVIVYVPRHLVAAVSTAVAERRRFRIDPVEIEVVEAPDAFLSGQESAVVSALNLDAPLPTFQGLVPIRNRGVSGRPTLVQNVETLAQVALVARFGSAWFRGLGSEQYPGTMLLTVHGRGHGPRIVESALNARLGDVLGLSPQEASHYQGVLLGGYGGGWLPISTALDLPVNEEVARTYGSSLGAGIAAFLPVEACPLAESARVVRYLDQQKAGQCGPCVYGLGDLAELTTALAVQPATLGGHLQPLVDACNLVDGRGACRHPDGAARFVRSTLRVFSDEVTTHLRRGPCRYVGVPSVLPGLRTIDLSQGWRAPLGRR
jgi:NADH:ubiquinone oxidoreductase subunit F (NADH-binding)